MSRIICDTYYKTEKKLWGDDPNHPFNQRIKAVNTMYGWLYQSGILEKASFQFREMPDVVCFAFDAKQLAPYRAAMSESGVEGSALAIQHLFDEPYKPCMYSGAIEPGWFMHSYRDVDGCVGPSWECSLVQGLNTGAIQNVRKVQEEQGVKAAVEKLFSFYHWPEHEKKPDLRAVIRTAGSKHSDQPKPPPSQAGMALEMR